MLLPERWVGPWSAMHNRCLKNETLLLLLLSKLNGRRHADAQAVTNQDVVRMARGGLSEEVIAGTIRSRGGRFDLSPDALIVLKSEGVGDGVIQAMQTSGGPQYVAGATTVAPPTVMTVPGPPSTVYVTPRPSAQIVIAPRRWHRRPRLHRHHW